MKHAHRHWDATKWLVFRLLLVWAAVSLFAGIILVEWLNQFEIGQVPLGFWMAQQGSIYVFVVLIFYYAWRMDRLDKDHNDEEKRGS